MMLKTNLNQVTLIGPEVFYDSRGWFSESYNSDKDWNFFPNGIQQVSTSFSHKNVVRGLHFQLGMSKAIRVLNGSIWLVNVDVDPSSTTFGKYYDTILSDTNKKICFATDLVARGFCALENNTVVEYFHDDVFQPKKSYSIKWNDPELNLHWPVEDPILSDKDATMGISLQEWRDYYLTMSMDM